MTGARLDGHDLLARPQGRGECQGIPGRVGRGKDARMRDDAQESREHETREPERLVAVDERLNELAASRMAVGVGPRFTFL
jgi:hypothetical protein